MYVKKSKTISCRFCYVREGCLVTFTFTRDFAHHSLSGGKCSECWLRFFPWYLKTVPHQSCQINMAGHLRGSVSHLVSFAFAEFSLGTPNKVLQGPCFEHAHHDVCQYACVGGCGWVWVGVGGCGWVWVGVGGCGCDEPTCVQTFALEGTVLAGPSRQSEPKVEQGLLLQRTRHN